MCLCLVDRLGVGMSDNVIALVLGMYLLAALIGAGVVLYGDWKDGR